jgi:hypothetical protein
MQLGISYFSPYLSALRWNFVNYYCKNAHTMFLSELLEEIPFRLEACLAACKFCSISKKFISGTEAGTCYFFLESFCIVGTFP